MMRRFHVIFFMYYRFCCFYVAYVAFFKSQYKAAATPKLTIPHTLAWF